MEESNYLSTNSESTEIISINSNSELILDWDIKNQLIVLLNNFTRSLLIDNISTKNINSNLEYNDKNNLIKSYLIKELNNLPLNRSIKRDEKLNKSNTIRLVSILDNQFRNDILEQLFAINFKHKYKKKIQKELINQNNNLIIKLINLNTEIKYSSNKLVDYKMDLDSFQPDTNNLSNYVTKTEFNNAIESLKDEINNFKISNDVKIGTRFNCVLEDIYSKLNLHQINISESFTYLDLEWKVIYEITINYVDHQKYLGLFLKVDNKIDHFNVNWQIEVEFEFRLKSKKLPDQIFKLNSAIFSKSLGLLGNAFIIPYNKLFDLRNGYIFNNSINLEVYLKADKVLKDIY